MYYYFVTKNIVKMNRTIFQSIILKITSMLYSSPYLSFFNVKTKKFMITNSGKPDYYAIMN